VLQRLIEGEVRFSAGSRALYASDASNFRQVPIGVVIPKTIDDVIATIDACRQYGAPVVSRGGGTSLSGETVNVAVVIDFSKYLHRVLEIDPVCGGPHASTVSPSARTPRRTTTARSAG
jgi:FAD/FMN-containing dehydrogenase